MMGSSFDSNDSLNLSEEEVVEFPGEPRSISNIGGEAHEPDSVEKAVEKQNIDSIKNNSIRFSFDFVFFFLAFFVFKFLE